MSWLDIFGCDEIATQFARANRRNRLGGSFLFVGPKGIGKRNFAFALGKALLCEKNFSKDEAVASRLDESDEAALAEFTPCGVCESCKRFEFDVASVETRIPTHPDFHYVCKPEDRSYIPISLLVGDKEDRSEAGLCYNLSLSAYMGGRKVAVIDDADYFNVEGANALLKTLEEPPANTIIILIGTSATKQLPTIRSRCQIFRFAPLATDDVAEILLRLGKVTSPEEATAFARVSGGSVDVALKALDSDFALFQNTILTELARDRLTSVKFATQVIEYVDKISKEATVRRPRLRNALEFAASFYRALYEELAFPSNVRRTSSQALVSAAKKRANSGDLIPEDALECLERTLQASDQVDQNANLPYVVETWLYDLSAILTRS